MNRQDIVNYFVGILEPQGHAEAGMLTLRDVKKQNISPAFGVIYGDTTISLENNSEEHTDNIQIWAYIKGNQSDKDDLIDNILEIISNNKIIVDKNNHAIAIVKNIVIISNDVERALAREQYYAIQFNVVINSYTNRR